MTEDALIAALRAIVEVPVAGARAPIAGIGDDAAVWQPSRSHLSVATTDALVDGVHFASDAMNPRDVGHRAMAANLSDVAAMGARPVLATIALGVSDAIDEDWILACYRGLDALARANRTSIVGGDIVRAQAAFLSITIVGEVRRSNLKRRSGGRPGHVLATTGPLGASRAGLELTRRSLDLDDAARAAAEEAFARPRPRLAEGTWLAASGHVHAMMDCSDGLSTDLGRLASASGCGATVESVPIAPAAAAVAAAAGGDAFDYALNGGEDFELLVAVGARAFSHLAQRFAVRFGRPLERVGTLDAEPGLRLRVPEMEPRDLKPRGWDHLAG
ncbi:MAG: thiamine-phosphate kinase [Candidatus Eremiobacteraeota bacterium]|nr:thiamine-phosphate kinase [Candidatus Eremiobacteraeota bacterium]